MDKKTNVTIRIGVLLGLCGLFVLIILGRLFWLQLMNTEYKQQMLELTRKTVDLYPERGQIVDKDGYVFAYDEKAFVLYLFPQEIEDKGGVAKQLQNILGVDEQKTSEWLTGNFTTADVEISAEQAEQLMAIESGGISVITQNQRRYPDGKLSGAVVGFTNREQIGTVGIESYYDRELQGVMGKTQLYSYSGGIPVPYQQEEVYPSQKGNTIRLTIDAELQKIMLEEGQKAYEEMTPKKMSIIAMDPNDGRVLGMLDFPALDANEPLEGRTPEEKEELETLTDDRRLEKQFQMWRSFSFQDIYEPGSVFKVITAAAAYEEGTADEDTVYHCDGLVTDIPGVTIRCWRYDDPHGDIDFTEAMDESCNVAFVEMIRTLGKEKARTYMEAFGFGEITNIGLPSEAEGIMPEGPASINEATFATNSYGHGVAVTPLQMLNAIAATVNGGTLFQPQIVQEITDEQGQVKESFQPKPLRRVLAQETSKAMRRVLQHGVEHGTADGGFIPGYKVGGKTGTTVKFIDGAYTQDIVVGSFVGVYPADNPEIAMLVVVDEPNAYPSGNTTAAPLARKILERYIALRGDEPTEELPETEFDPTVVEGALPANADESILEEPDEEEIQEEIPVDEMDEGEPMEDGENQGE